MSTKVDNAARTDEITDSLSDEILLQYVNSGQNWAQEVLIQRYQYFVRMKARTYFLIGADKEDILQEGMIGLFKAIRDFKKEKYVSFRAFAELCVTRQIITAIKTATRQKHIPLNSYVSLNKPAYQEEGDRTLMDLVKESHQTNPEELMISRENFESMFETLNEVLSNLERDVLSRYVSGQSYHEIAAVLNRPVKSIDNALQRIKKKLEKHISYPQK